MTEPVAVVPMYATDRAVAAADFAPYDPLVIQQLYQAAELVRHLALKLEHAVQERDAVLAVVRDMSEPEPNQATTDMMFWQRTMARGIADEVRARLRNLRTLNGRS